MARRSYLITGRITEKECPAEDITFYEEKIKKGYSNTTFLREVTNIARRYEDGSLLREELSKILEEKLPIILPIILKKMNYIPVIKTEIASTKEQEIDIKQAVNEMTIEKTILQNNDSKVDKNEPSEYYELTDEDKKAILDALT